VSDHRGLWQLLRLRLKLDRQLPQNEERETTMAKIRSGFISNSSSSSFIIAGSANHLKNGYLNVQVKMKHLIDEIIEDETQLAAYFECDYGKNWREDGDWLIECYDAAIAELQAGKTIAIGNISSEGGGAETMFYDCPEMFEDAVENSGGFKLVMGVG
jgi:hypothetical protein